MVNTATRENKWNWLVAVACFCTMFTTIGVLRISGVLYISITHIYGVSRETASWPFYIRRIIAMFSALFCGLLEQFLDIRVQVFVGILLCSLGIGLCYFAKEVIFITLSFGILYGIGSGIVRVSNIIIINRYFSKYRTIATGLTLCGISLGAFIFPPFTDFLIEIYGLKGSFLLISGILLQGLMAASLYKIVAVPRRYKSSNVAENLKVEEDSKVHETVISQNSLEVFVCESANSNENKNASDKSSHLQETSSKENQMKKSQCFTVLLYYLNVFKFPMFYVIAISSTIAGFSFYTYNTIIIDYATDCGISRHNSVFLLSASSISEMIGRIGCGFIIDLGVLKRESVIQISFIGLALVFTIIPMWNYYGVLIASAILNGFFASCLIVNNSILYTEHLGIQNLPYAIGTGTVLSGLINFSIPFLIGYCRDIMGNYNLLFYIFGSLHLFAAILWMRNFILKCFVFSKCK